MISKLHLFRQSFIQVTNIYEHSVGILEALGSRRPGLWDLAIPRKRNGPDDLHLFCEDFERTGGFVEAEIVTG